MLGLCALICTGTFLCHAVAMPSLVYITISMVGSYLCAPPTSNPGGRSTSATNFLKKLTMKTEAAINGLQRNCKTPTLVEIRPIKKIVRIRLNKLRQLASDRKLRHHWPTFRFGFGNFLFYREPQVAFFRGPKAKIEKN